MKTVKIADAKNNLSRYLQYVRKGGRVRILDRTTPVADLVPVQSDATPTTDDEWIADMERRGVCRPGRTGNISAIILKPGPRVRGAGLVRAVLDERDESW